MNALDSATISSSPVPAAPPPAAAAGKPRPYVHLGPGDPAPLFTQRTTINPEFAFDTIAGRYVVLGFFVSAGNEAGRKAIEGVFAHRQIFDDRRMSFFGVSLDPKDESEGRVKDSVPGIRYFWDWDRKVSKLYGSLPADARSRDGSIFHRFWVVLDPTLRVMRVFPFVDGDHEHKSLFAYLAQLPPPGQFLGFEMQAPVVILPNVFEPELCRQLVELYERDGGGESGFMREVNGMTVGVQDFSHINLNADFEGGELSFPEYGPRSFKAPPGAALIFPGAILHAVSKVTHGRRYAFLPFLYDEAAAKIRAANKHLLKLDGAVKPTTGEAPML